MRAMNRFRSTRSTVVRTARPLLALMLLIACLSTSVPLIASALAPALMCELACCAGRAPHVAGSCLNGSCHAVLPNRSKASHRVGRIASRPDHLCGVPRRLETKSSARIRPAQTISRTNSEQTSLSVVSLARPCQPECGGCFSSFTNSNQQRNAATFAHPASLRPPLDVRLADLAYRNSQILDALCRQYAPRGPPLSFS
jgi:hypothetical protein